MPGIAPFDADPYYDGAMGFRRSFPIAPPTKPTKKSETPSIADTILGAGSTGVALGLAGGPVVGAIGGVVSLLDSIFD